MLKINTVAVFTTFLFSGFGKTISFAEVCIMCDDVLWGGVGELELIHAISRRSLFFMVGGDDIS